MLAGAAFAGLGVAARLALLRWLRARPLRDVSELSGAARALVDAARAGVDASRVIDLHVHALGLGTAGSGCWVHPSLASAWHPIERLRYDVTLAAAGVEDAERAEAQYVERVLALHRAAHPRGRMLVLALDWFVDPDGRERPELSTFHVPDAYVFALARAHPELVACASVHPHRADALERLERARENGARAVKWLPNAMGIDPASPRCDRFYARLAEVGWPLLTHTGGERAVRASAGQELGNPLRLRRALEHGVTVVALHCAILGDGLDLDRPERERAERANLELLLRLFDEPPRAGRLYGEISGITQQNRCDPALARLLERPDLHPRLVDGSDYPLCAIDPVISSARLARLGLVDPLEVGALDEIFDANPLLFDFVLKRRVRLARGGAELRFAPEVFESARVLAG